MVGLNLSPTRMVRIVCVLCMLTEPFLVCFPDRSTAMAFRARSPPHVCARADDTHMRMTTLTPHCRDLTGGAELSEKKMCVSAVCATESLGAARRSQDERLEQC